MLFVLHLAAMAADDGSQTPANEIRDAIGPIGDGWFPTHQQLDENQKTASGARPIKVMKHETTGLSLSKKQIHGPLNSVTHISSRKRGNRDFSTPRRGNHNILKKPPVYSNASPRQNLHLSPSQRRVLFPEMELRKGQTGHRQNHRLLHKVIFSQSLYLDNVAPKPSGQRPRYDYQLAA